MPPDIYFTEMPKHLDMVNRSELLWTNEFSFAVAVILSAQTTDKQVNTVMPAIIAVADTPEKMVALGIDGLKQLIRTISFFNNKAKNIVGLAKALVEQLAERNNSPLGLGAYNSPLGGRFVIPAQAGTTALSRAPVGGKSIIDKTVLPPIDADDTASTPPQGGSYHALPDVSILPRNRTELMKLPGIGAKTANVIMNVLWGAPQIGVDTHVFRNAHRYGWVSDAENTPDKVEAALTKFIPKKYHGIVNHVMVLHGRYTCKALRPKCGECPVAKWCNAACKRGE